MVWQLKSMPTRGGSILTGAGIAMLGCMMSINPDAHSTGELGLTHWGVEMARKGGVPTERVLNALTLAQISSYFSKRRPRTLFF
jgi:DNA polymerase (family 10)